MKAASIGESTDKIFSGPRTLDSTYLVPESGFPSDLAVLGTGEVQVLHSRATRQLDREYLTADGPSLETQTRCYELATALDACENTISGGTNGGPPTVEEIR